MEKPWFQSKNCTSLEIKKFRTVSEKDAERSIRLEDAKAIRGLMDRIEKIPMGNEMISFGPKAERVDLLFHCENQTQDIQIFQKKFKTPTTAFNSDKTEIEEGLYADIDALLSPDFKKNLLKVENLELSFKDFSITYKGSEFRDMAPKSLQLTINRFLVKDRNKKEQIIEITSGQLPPQPQKVEVDGAKITILSYETKDSFRLYPNYFQVVR